MIDDIVPITEGKLRAFMYESYAKGQEDATRSERDRLKSRVKDIINSVIDYGISDKYDRVKSDIFAIIDDEQPEEQRPPARFRDIGNAE